MEAATLGDLGGIVMLRFGIASLSTLGASKPYSFSLLLTHQEDDKEGDLKRCLESFRAEQERFQLWAANLGLQATGDRSLEYRVQDSASVKSYTRQLLNELAEDLRELALVGDKRSNDSDRENRSELQEEDEEEELEEDEEEELVEKDEELGEEEEKEERGGVKDSCEKQKTKMNQEEVLSRDIPDDSDPDEDLSDAENPQTKSAGFATILEDIESILDDISDINDRLYRLASKLRNSASRAPPSARNFYREPLIYPDGTEFYLTSDERKAAKEQSEEYYKNRIEEIIRQSMRDEDGDPFPKEDHTPYLSLRAKAAIRRIAMANAYRQQQFAFWRSREWDRRHAVKYQATVIQLPQKVEKQDQKVQEPISTVENKVIKKPNLEAPAKSRVVSSEVPSATWKMMKEPTLAGLDETRSLSSKTEFTSSPTVYEPSGRKVGWPPFPKELGKKKDFICPYCFVTCPANYRGKGHWRAHLIQDLQPYTCLAEHCDEGDSKLLNTWEEWIIHEQVYHRMEYSCRHHLERTFTNREAYAQHITQEHPDEQDELLKITGHNSNAQLAPRPRSGCPLCSYEAETWPEMDKHLAYHLENLALLSLPLATGLEREDGGKGSLQLERDEDDAMKLLDDEVTGALDTLFETDSVTVQEWGVPSRRAEGLTEVALSKLTDNQTRNTCIFERLRKEDTLDAFQRVDDDTGVDLYEAMLYWDFRHIQELYPLASQTLTDRLARANVNRRKRIDWLRLHAHRSDYNLLAELLRNDDAHNSLMPFPVTVFHHEYDDKSMIKVKLLEYTWILHKFKTYTDRISTCPICETVLSHVAVDFLGAINHLKLYFSPYICTERDCDSPNALYASLDDWVVHMAEHSHRRKEMCPLCIKPLSNPYHLPSCLRRAAALVIPRIFYPMHVPRIDSQATCEDYNTTVSTGGFFERVSDFIDPSSKEQQPLPEDDWDPEEHDDYIDPDYIDNYEPANDHAPEDKIFQERWDFLKWGASEPALDSNPLQNSAIFADASSLEEATSAAPKSPTIQPQGSPSGVINYVRLRSSARKPEVILELGKPKAMIEETRGARSKPTIINEKRERERESASPYLRARRPISYDGDDEGDEIVLGERPIKRTISPRRHSISYHDEDGKTFQEEMGLDLTLR